MKVAHKLLLAAAIAVASSGSYAMEALGDEALSETTGQQGIDIFLNLNQNDATVTYTDADGFTGATASGDLIISNLDLIGNIKASIDVGASTSTNDAALRMSVSDAGSSGLTIRMDGLKVKKSSAAIGTALDVITMPANTTIQIGTGYNFTFELGKGPLGHLAQLTGNIGTIGIGDNSTTTAKVAIVDSTNSGSISMSKLTLTGVDLGSGGANATNVDVCDGVAVTANCAAGAAGLKMTFAGTAMAAMGVTVDDLRLGATTSPIMGKVTVSGLNLSGTSVRIVGH